MQMSLIARDISWLHFNARVLQEATDKSVPLYERIKFLAIYSSNLDEFYRVRVSSLRQFKKLTKEERRRFFDFKPKKELKAIRKMVSKQQEEFGRIFREEILPGLEEENIKLLHYQELNKEQSNFARQYFDDEIASHLESKDLPVEGEADFPFIKNRHLYLAVDLANDEDERMLLVNVPSPPVSRFVVLPKDKKGNYCVCFVDSIIRANLERHLGLKIDGAYSFKLSRDAEMYIDNEFDGDLKEKIEKSLSNRDDGLPTRCLYDANMPKWMRKALKDRLELSKYDLIPGARYHNFMDFFGFPLPEGREDLIYPEYPPLPHPRLERAESLIKAIQRSDHLLHFPYQRYDYVPALIREAADTPSVKRIQITLYRVASKSNVVTNLLYALKRGKKVEVFVEAKARFDEASNLFWGKELEKAGARVQYSFPAVKVHTKLLHIVQKDEDGSNIHLSYVGTGNFNEKTAKLYGDHALLTSHPGIGEDIAKVFDLLRGRLILPNCNHLLVAPFNMQSEFLQMIDNEIKIAKDGGNGFLFLKMNSLEEETMIEKIREAAAAGVEVRLIVRGICRLVPDDGENIQIISIIDRFLEHARIFIFGNNGNEKVFMGSADWMNRNLHRRVEVITPIYDPTLQLELRHLMDMQWRDNTKARLIHERKNNEYQVNQDGERGNFRAQEDMYRYFERKMD
ncbi:polyphosphate kinase 1 [Lewinellaceae bacterium SD302]|nr:polyphosphate kinase 1 [Lewinellaceae bacterium SD302]